MTVRQFCNMPIFAVTVRCLDFGCRGLDLCMYMINFVVTEGRSVRCSSLVLSKRGGRNTLGKYPYPERKEINRSRRFRVL